MALTSFDDLCASLCSLVGIDAPQLAPDEDGVVGFTITLDEVDIGFVQGARDGEPGMLMVANFGAPDEASEVRVLRELMSANFLLSGVGAPAFVRNPVTREFSLHQSWLLSQITAQDLYQTTLRAANAVKLCKAGSFLRPPGQHEPPTVHGAERLATL